MKEGIDLIKSIEYFSLFIKQGYPIVWNVEKIQKVEIQKLQEQKRKKNVFIKMCSLW